MKKVSLFLFSCLNLLASISLYGQNNSILNNENNDDQAGSPLMMFAKEKTPASNKSDSRNKNRGSEKRRAGDGVENSQAVRGTPNQGIVEASTIPSENKNFNSDDFENKIHNDIYISFMNEAVSIAKKAGEIGENNKVALEEVNKMINAGRKAALKIAEAEKNNREQKLAQAILEKKLARATLQTAEARVVAFKVKNKLQRQKAEKSLKEALVKEYEATRALEVAMASKGNSSFKTPSFSEIKEIASLKSNDGNDGDSKTKTLENFNSSTPEKPTDLTSVKSSLTFDSPEAPSLDLLASHVHQNQQSRLEAIPSKFTQQSAKGLWNWKTVVMGVSLFFIPYLLHATIPQWHEAKLQPHLLHSDKRECPLSNASLSEPVPCLENRKQVTLSECSALWNEREVQPAIDPCRQPTFFRFLSKKKEEAGRIGVSDAFDNAEVKLEKAIVIENAGNTVLAQQWRKVSDLYRDSINPFLKAASLRLAGESDEGKSWNNAGLSSYYAADRLGKAIEMEHSGDAMLAQKWYEISELYENSADSFLKGALAHATGENEEGTVWDREGLDFIDKAGRLEVAIGSSENATLT